MKLYELRGSRREQLKGTESGINYTVVVIAASAEQAISDTIKTLPGIVIHQLTHRHDFASSWHRPVLIVNGEQIQAEGGQK